MTISHPVIAGLILVVLMVGCDSMEHTVSVEPGTEGSLRVANATAETWSDARLVVEAVEHDNSTSVCAEETRSVWRPGESISVPECGDKIRLTLTVSGETARFSYANGQLFRRFGRKEVPVGGS
jgi:hypothetical protein